MSLRKRSYLVESKIPSITKWVDTWETDDYPYGRHRTTAVWKVEKKGAQERVARVTLNPKTGRPNKPKKTTYGKAAKLGIVGDRAYIVVGGPGQIAVYDGSFKYLDTAFTDSPDYKMLAKGLGIATVASKAGKVQVKKSRNGAMIDGLQGTTTTIREILLTGGLSDGDIKEVKSVGRKYRMGKGSIWTVKFKDERSNYVITVRD